MEKSAHVRADIRNFLPSARSVIVMGTVYNTDQGSGTRDAGSQGPSDAIKVARYARGQDYHKVIEDRLLELVEWMKASSREPFEAAHFVDKHQVQERVFAHHAGIGWIGKNSCVINPELGSWMFLSGIATSLDLAARRARARSVRRPARSASTRVRPARIVDARELDATKCISYLTIETEGEIPEAQRPQIGQPRVGLRHLPGRVPVEPWRGSHRRSGLAGPHRATACRRPRCGSSRTMSCTR